MARRWLWLLLAAALAASAAEDPGDEPGAEPVEDGGKYTVYEKTNYDGVKAFHIIQAEKFRGIVEKATTTNKALRTAYAEARKAWREDKKNRGERFPLRAPRPIRIQRLSTYPTREKAENAALKRQDTLDWKAEREKEREQRRVERLSETARKREKEEADRLRRAEKLLERKVEQVLREQEEKAKEAEPDDEPKEAEGKVD